MSLVPDRRSVHIYIGCWCTDELGYMASCAAFPLLLDFLSSYSYSYQFPCYPWISKKCYNLHSFLFPSNLKVLSEAGWMSGPCKGEKYVTPSSILGCWSTKFDEWLQYSILHDLIYFVASGILKTTCLWRQFDKFFIHRNCTWHCGYL